jgi:curved DNA-binding protein CbpA
MSAQDLYEELGVEKDASEEDIKKAYRRRSKETHPDAGGSADEFRALQRAYNVLADQEKRSRYDRGESPETIDGTSPDAAAIEIIRAIFLDVASSVDDPYTSPLEEIRKRIDAKQQQGRDLIAKQRRTIARLEKAKGKLKAKGEENFLTPALDREIENVNGAISRIEGELRIGDRVKEILQGYEYAVEKRPEIPPIGQGLSAEFLRQQGDALRGLGDMYNPFRFR